MTPATKKECLARIFVWASLAAGVWGVLGGFVYVAVQIVKGL